MRIERIDDNAISDQIRSGLRQFNLTAAPPSTPYISIEVKLAVIDDDGMVHGGVLGRIFRSALEIEILWVSESLRGKGYGQRLMEEAEKIAIENKCAIIHLDTFSFQAPDFYKKMGFEVFGVLEGYSDNATRYYLRKKL